MDKGMKNIYLQIRGVSLVNGLTKNFTRNYNFRINVDVGYERETRVRESLLMVSY